MAAQERCRYGPLTLGVRVRERKGHVVRRNVRAADGGFQDSTNYFFSTIDVRIVAGQEQAIAVGVNRYVERRLNRRKVAIVFPKQADAVDKSGKVNGALRGQ
ncbi:MAG: hypothetical protein JO104_01580 [Candidatus Eremiobacteraeota bacterium]|nr:hypothetical protein [Candidatus Eremiobacteraeota bacterium]